MTGSKKWTQLYPESVRLRFDISPPTLNHVLENAVSRYPDQLAVVFKDVRWTYAELKEKVDNLASALKGIGIRKGDRVAMMLQNCPEFVAAYYAIMKVGGIAVMLNPMNKAPELSFYLNDSGAETMIASDAAHEILMSLERTPLKRRIWVHAAGSSPAGGHGDLSFERLTQKGEQTEIPAAPIGPDDTAVLLYTGGTTGRSKGVMLTHGNLVANIAQHDEVYRDVLVHGSERVMIPIPLFHSYGMTVGMNLGILQGSCLILMERFQLEEAVQLIETHKPTRFLGMPTIYVALNSHPRIQACGMDNIKICHSGGAPIPVELIHEIERKTGVTIMESYGLTECSPGVLGQPSKQNRRIGSVGIPLPMTDCKIVDLETGTREMPPGERGELIIKGPQVMKSYWQRPEEMALAFRDGWLYTGDIAQMDEDGYFYIVDRKKDMIIASGYNVYPREIEEVLYQHPAVREAVVVGVKDPYRGETVKAFISLKAGAAASEEEIIQHCKSNLSAYKVPKLIEFRPELPKSDVGKLLRKVLAEEAAGGKS